MSAESLGASPPAAAQKPAAKPKKASGDKPWKPMAPGDAALTLSRSVHYSSKPVNTNAVATGVRLGADEKVDLPYVAYSTLKVDRRITDYLQGGAPAAAPFNQSASVIEGIVDDKYAGCTADQKTQVLSEAPVLDKPLVMGEWIVDPRMRQLLFPVTGGDYVALSPLHSSPFSKELARRVAEEKEHDDKVVTRRVAVLKIGGDNNQNVGRHIYAMTRPLVFMAPIESPAVRKAWAVFYKGVTLRSLIPASQIEALKVWRREHRPRADSAITSRLDTRSEEAQMLAEIATTVLRRAQAIGASQDCHSESLGGRVSSSVDVFTRGLIDPAQRERGWAREFSIRLIQEIEQYRRGRDQSTLTEAGDLASLVDMIEGVVR